MRKQYHSRPVGTDTHIWDVHRLIRLSRAITPLMIPIARIQELDENWWYQDASHIPTPRAIAAHMTLVNATDLDHPVILCADGRLMDGMHRAVKALITGAETILAVQFPVTPDPDFINVALDDLPYGDEAL